MSERLYGRELDLYEVVEWLESDAEQRQPGAKELHDELKDWVKRAAEQLARTRGGQVDYAYTGQVLLALPRDD